jgi:hypothetical protein
MFEKALIRGAGVDNAVDIGLVAESEEVDGRRKSS